MTEFDEAITRILNGALPRDLETSVLEFKQDTGSLKANFELLADAVVCFANAVGGTIVFGVADKMSGAEALIGVSPGQRSSRRDRTSQA